MRTENNNAITRHKGAGRPNKYPFHTLEPGGMLIIPVAPGDNHKFEAIKISTALCGWKRRNAATDWVTAVRNTETEVHVHRII